MHLALEDKNACIMTHRGETVVWNVGAFDKTKFSDVEDPFKEINGFWNWIGIKEQDAIWEAYVKIRDVIDQWAKVLLVSDEEPIDVNGLVTALTGHVESLYRSMPLEKIKHWIDFYANIIYPDNLLTELNPDDLTPDGTYLRSDYDGLVILATALRPLVPVWGEFINITAKEAGTNLKEFLAIKILSKTEILASPYVDRLVRYIESRITKDVDCTAAIVGGLSTSVIPEWLLSMVMIRRLAIGSINASAEKGSIISNIYVFVFNTLKDLDKKFGGMREKYPEDPDKEEEGSFLESYRVKQTLTIGDAASLNVYTEDCLSMARGVDATIPESYVNEGLEILPRLSGLEISPIHLHLAQWVMARVMTPHAIPSLNKQSLLRILITVQALMRYWGYNDLALLVTATGKEPPMDEMRLDPNSRVPMDVVDTLSHYYPYSSPQEINNSRKTNLAYLAIMTLNKDIRTNIWWVCAPNALIDQCKTAIERGKLRMPPTMAEQLARLVIKLNELREGK